MNCLVGGKIYIHVGNRETISGLLHTTCELLAFEWGSSAAFWQKPNLRRLANKTMIYSRPELPPCVSLRPLSCTYAYLVEFWLFQEWKGAGSSTGIESKLLLPYVPLLDWDFNPQNVFLVWRVEKLGIKRWPQEEYGKFFDGMNALASEIVSCFHFEWLPISLYLR